VASLLANVVGLTRPRSAPRHLVPVGNVLLVGAWLWLSRSSLAWLARCFADTSARTNAVLLAVALLILLVQARSAVSARALLVAVPRMRLLPLGLLVGCALAQVFRSRLLDSSILASAAFVVGTQGLAGLYLPQAGWRRGWIAVLVAVALLPFGPHIDAFLGFPARVATAHLARNLLGAAGVVVQSADAILIFENGVANVDLPCSGVKGLWVGGIFFLALTWLEKRKLGWRWLAAGLAFLAALAAANFLRVLLLVMLGFVFRQPSLATLVHLPLGVFGFVMACGLAVFMVRRLPACPADSLAPPAPERPLGLGTLPLIGMLLGLATLGTGVSHTRGFANAEIQLPSAWSLTSLSFEDKESRLFERHLAQQASKWHFRVGQSEGTLLVVVANSFRAHHAPEVCLASTGHTIDGVRRELLGPGLPIKFIDSDANHASTVTWFQSASATTDSLMQRTLAELLHGDRRWALVSVFFDGPATLDAATSALLEQLHAAVRKALTTAHPKGS
jgi:exosortase O